jgi:collagenase-like PrtC family protease
METRLNGILIDRFAEGERTGYPTLCKGRFEVEGETYYAIEEPASLNTLELLPELARVGIRAIKIEGRQRSPAYVAQVTKVWRAAIDAVMAAPERFRWKRPGWPNSTRSPRARAIPSAPTTGRGNDPAAPGAR